MTKQKDVRKSNFVEVDSSQATDRFDLVRNGQNLKISQANLVNDFGVSGPLQTRGEVTAIPVLEVIANVNYIRNILGGSGINVQLSAQDGIEISHNFDVDDTGVPIMINTTSASPTFRSLQAGAGINVAAAGDIIQIAATAIPESTKTIIIYDINDFPAAVGDLITLEADTEYKLENDVSSAFRFQLSNNTILSGADRALVTLEYTGIGTMITATDVTTKIKDLSLSCATGTVFDVSSTSGLNFFKVVSVNCICDYVGTLDNLAVMHFRNTDFIVYSDGFILSGTFAVIIFDTAGIRIPSGAGNAITLGTSVITYYVSDKALIDVNSTGYSISGLANSGNIDPDGMGLIINSRNFGTAALSDNIYPTNDRWTFYHNTKVPDSYETALATHGGATLTIAAAATPVLVGATWTNQKLSRFTGTAAGTWTFTGIQTHIEIAVSITVDIALGIDNLAFFIYKNGVQVPGSRVNIGVDSGVPSNVVLLWEDDIVTNDYFQLYAQNTDTNEDIIVGTATMRIRS